MDRGFNYTIVLELETLDKLTRIIYYLSSSRPEEAQMKPQLDPWQGTGPASVVCMGAYKTIPHTMPSPAPDKA